FLAQTAHHIGAARIAVAHHADDQAETVLMRLLRGASSPGLAGMELSGSLPTDPSLTLIRPLLFNTRAEIQAYADEHGLVPCIDSTNADTNYLRNHIRLNLLPQLEAINSAIRQTLSRMAEVAALEDDFMHNQLMDALPSLHVIETPKRISARRAAYRDLHPALRRRWIRWAALRINPSLELDYHHIRLAAELALHGRQGAVAQLGDGLSLRVDYDWLHVEVEQGEPSLSEYQSMPLVLPGFSAELSPGDSLSLSEQWTLRVEPDCPLESDSSWLRLTIPSTASIIVRTRRPGDLFRPIGLRGHAQKLSDWMIDRKLPRALRDQIPLICVDDQIAAFRVNEDWVIATPFTESGDPNHRSVWLSYRQNLPT
ncbi:MAG: tRNA lysidine(34) synthetase TilS, partial [Anaerolineae bacterium]|nr:tRNA lysidine(34) synthetase TilS [Anaerolineae bacterium]